MSNKYRLRLDKVNPGGTFRTIVEGTYPSFHDICANISAYIKMPKQEVNNTVNLRGRIAGLFKFKYNDFDFIAKITPTSWEL